MNVLELFSGTESFSKVARARGHKTFTVDINSEFSPDLVSDILDFDYKQHDRPNIIWASPPCQCFSVASIRHHWTDWETPKSELAVQALKIVKRTLKIIEYYKPDFWFIENPRAMLRKQDIMYTLPRYTVTYCQYGDTRMKPTDIWTNLKEWNPKKCLNGSPCHEPAPRGSRAGTQGIKGAKNRAIVPQRLCEELLILCEEAE